MKFVIFLIFFLLMGCSFNKKGLEANSYFSKARYGLQDLSGRYNLIREVGHLKSKNDFIVKRKLSLSGDISDRAVETSITISTPGTLNGVRVFRPKVSQFTVWFDQKKYFSELKFDKAKKSLKITLKSPEKKWNGSKEVPFPEGTGVYCFFSQLSECIGATGFFKRAREEKSGRMHFHIIWDGYPYFMEQYANVEQEVFAASVLEYNRSSDNSMMKFALYVTGQTIFLEVDERGRLVNRYWAQQGYSMKKK